MALVMFDHRVNWTKSLVEYTNSGIEGLSLVEREAFRRVLTLGWINAALNVGLEAGLYSLQNKELRTVLLNNDSWDDLVTAIDSRNCSKWVSLGSVILCFFVCQVFFLLLFLWPIVRKYLICNVQKINEKYYINFNVKSKGQTKAVRSESNDHGYDYTVLHVNNLDPDWLPARMKLHMNKEVKESKELIKEFRRKIREFDREFQRRMTQRIDDGKAWWQKINWKKAESSAKVNERKNENRTLRRSRSAIPAKEFEKKKVVNEHLRPFTPVKRPPKTATSLHGFEMLQQK